MNKVILTTDELRCRIDRLQSLLDDRAELFKKDLAKEKDYFLRETAKVKAVMDYVKSDDWIKWVSGIKRVVYIKRSLTDIILKRKGTEVVAYRDNDKVLEEVKEQVIQLLGADSLVPVKVLKGYEDTRRSLNYTHTCLCIDYTLEVRSHIPHFRHKSYPKLPIEELNYLVRLGKDVEVDTDWLRKIDEIDK